MAIVVSAMAGETDRLLELCSAITDVSDFTERDVVASTGETVTAALTALTLQSLGGKARSFLAGQLPILTDSTGGEAQILSIDVSGIRNFMDLGGIPVIAGFQGINSEGRMTTLGRGGSDTTSV